MIVLTRVFSFFFFYKKMYDRFAARPKKSDRNNEVHEVAVRRGSTVVCTASIMAL